MAKKERERERYHINIRKHEGGEKEHGKVLKACSENASSLIYLGAVIIHSW